MKAEPNRVAYGEALIEVGQSDPRIVVFEAGSAKSTRTYRFAERFPERFFNCGSAELNMVCMAAGAATTGLTPFASTLAVFASMRASEGIRQSICRPRLNVKIVATHAGVESAGAGPSRQAIEDFSIMRAMPNLTVLAPCDPVTTRAQTLWAADYDGPVYMRLGSQLATPLYTPDTPFQVGKMTRLHEGRDVTIIAVGAMTEQALVAARTLSAEGVGARVLDCHTLKPIDREQIHAAAEETLAIVTAEDHNVIGGLGSAVCEVVAETRPTVVKRVGLHDCFAGSGRDHRALMAHYSLDAAAIVKAAHEVLRSR